MLQWLEIWHVKEVRPKNRQENLFEVTILDSVMVSKDRSSVRRLEVVGHLFTITCIHPLAYTRVSTGIDCESLRDRKTNYCKYLGVVIDR